jgi:hypothetical protein
MKSISLVEQTGPNPGYDAVAHRAAKRSGQPYNVPPEITYPAGTVFEDPEAWIPCCSATPTRRPADAACAAKVQAFLAHPARKALLARFKHMATEAVFKTLPTWLQEYVSAINQKWSAQMASVQADSSATAEHIVEAIEALGGTVPSDASGSRKSRS